MARLFTALTNTAGESSAAGIENLAKGFQQSFFQHKALQRQEEQDRIALERQQRSDALAAERHAQQMQLGEQRLRITEGQIRAQEAARSALEAQQQAGLSTLQGKIDQANKLLDTPTFAGGAQLQSSLDELSSLQMQLAGAESEADVQGIEQAMLIKLQELDALVTEGTLAGQRDSDIRFISKSSEELGIAFTPEQLEELREATPMARAEVVEKLQAMQGQQRDLASLKGTLTQMAQGWAVQGMGPSASVAQANLLQVLNSAVPSQWTNPATKQTIRIDTPQEVEDYYQFQYNQHLIKTLPEDIQQQIAAGEMQREEIAALQSQIQLLQEESGALFERTQWRDMQAQVGAGASGVPMTATGPAQAQAGNDVLSAAQSMAQQGGAARGPAAAGSNAQDRVTPRSRELGRRPTTMDEHETAVPWHSDPTIRRERAMEVFGRGTPELRAWVKEEDRRRDEAKRQHDLQRNAEDWSGSPYILKSHDRWTPETRDALVADYKEMQPRAVEALKNVPRHADKDIVRQIRSLVEGSETWSKEDWGSKKAVDAPIELRRLLHQLAQVDIETNGPVSAWAERLLSGMAFQGGSAGQKGDVDVTTGPKPIGLPD